MDIAQTIGAVIISADAMTIYRELDVGTAKPSLMERRGIPHYCVDVRAYNEVYSVGDFVEDTHAVIREHEHVIIAGGTPYYLNALFRPLAPLPESQPSVRQALEQLLDPYQRLREVDAIAAERLHPNDRYRIIRALEVYEITGRPLTEVQQDPPKYPPLEAEIVWLEREDLRPRIGQRIEQMMSQGYLEECQHILDAKWDLSAKPFNFSCVSFTAPSGRDVTGRCHRTNRDWNMDLARKQRTWSRNIGWNGILIEEAKSQNDRWISVLGL